MPSFHLLAINWIHTGIASHWSSTLPIGTDMAGIQAIFAGMVYISARYILSGSPDFAHNFRATSGEVGVRMIS